MTSPRVWTRWSITSDEATEEVRIAYPLDLFDRNIIDGRMMMVSFLTLTIGNNQGMGDIEYAKMYDFYVPRRAIELFDGPAVDISDLWRILGRPVDDGGYIAGTIIKPKLGLRPEPFAQAAYEFWLGGDFIKNDEPQGNQVFAPLRKTIPLVYDAMKRAMDETGEAKLFSANITADDHAEMIARGEFILSAFGPDADKVAFLVDGYVGGPGHGHHRPPLLLPPVPALPPGRPWRGHLAEFQARLHRLRAGEDVAAAGRLGHPRRHDGLREDGGRRRRPGDRLHLRAGASTRARSTSRSGTGCVRPPRSSPAG